MKNKFVKRIISVLLSALMVISMIPTFALSAYADTVSNHIVGAYLTRNATDGVSTAHGSVTWDNINGAYFDGDSFLRIDGTPLNSVTNSSGFTISFEVSSLSQNNDSRVFMFANNDARDYFGFNSGSVSNAWERNAVLYRVNWAAQTGLWTADFWNNDYFASHTVDSWSPTDGTKYRYTISMDADGYMYYYKDGQLLGKLRNDYYTQSVGHDVRPTYLKQCISNFTNYQIGSGNGIDGSHFKGYIKNMYLFDSCLSDSEAQSEITSCTGGTIEQLENAIDAYESKMDGTVYTNMGPAYQAYVMANKARDSYKYGKDNTINLSLYIDPLIRATQNMSTWTATANITNATPYFSTDGNTNASYYITNGNGTWYNNLLYTEDSSSQACIPTDWRSGKYIGVQIRYSNNTVLFYDGLTDSLMPVVAKVYNTGTKAGGTRVAYTIYPTNGYAAENTSDNDNTEIQLKETWHGNDGTQDCFMYCISQSERVGRFASNPENNWSASVRDKDSKKFYASALKVLNSVDFNGKAYKNFNLQWQFYAGSAANSSGSQNRSDMYAWDTSASNIYVLNYKEIKSAINNETHVGYLSDIESYSQGGLLDVINGYNYLTSNISTTSHDWSGDITLKVFDDALVKINSSTTEDVPNYNTLRSYLSDGLGTKTIGSLGTYTVQQVIADSSLNADTVTNYAAFETAYNNAVNHMAGVISNGYTGVGNLATNLQSTFNSLDEKGAEAPSITADCYLEPNGTVSITNNDPQALDIKYTIAYDGGAAGETQTVSSVASGSSTSVNVFGGSTSHSTAIVSAWAVKNGKNSSTASGTYTLLKAPSFSVDDNAVISKEATVSLTNTNEVGTIQYSLNGTNFTSGDSVAPFADNTSSVKTVYAKVVYNNLESAVSQINVLRKASFTIYTNNSKGNNFFDNNTTIFIEDTSNYSDNIVYTLVADGTAIGTIHTYDKTNKINLATDNSVAANAIKNADIVEIVAYAAPHGEYIGSEGTLTATATLVNVNAVTDTLVYHESFDNASINSSNFTSSNGNGTLGNGSTGVQILPSWDGTLGTGTDGNGNVNGLRKNVLKLSQASNHASENKIVLDANPLSSGANKSFAKNDGVTISFWRALSSNETSLWIPGVAFVGEDVSSEYTYNYFEINAAGILSFNNGNVGDNGLPYIDILLRNNDSTTHATGTTNTAWVNFTVTIDPNSGIKYYVNGKEYLTSYNYGSSQTQYSVNYDSLSSNGDHRLDYENNAAMAKDLLDLITSGKVKFEIGGGDPYNTNYCDTYIDDVRVYVEALTQVDVNNMFFDENTDAYKEGTTTRFSTSHDPTDVTVYTLTESVATDNGTKAAGSQVGVEFIEYYNVPSSKYTVEYYSFGTDMTIYHSNDNVNWTVLGDDHGRCGYQNQKLYGGVYTEVLEEQLLWCTQATNFENATGAGYLQWAPHVMYNLELDKWCYYGSTSDWSSAKSAIFMGTSEDIEGPYEDIETVFKSGDGYWDSNPETPANAIDSCVYYGHNSDGSINPNELYLIYGSWGPGYVLTLNSDGSYSKSFGDSGYAGTKVYEALDGNREATTSGGSGEGSYVIYENGYYYFYITMGHNGGNYQERVFRSTLPNGGFETINGSSATYESGADNPHGNPIFTAYYLPVNNYIYTSVGHNSLYKAVNNRGEFVYINSAHTRPYSTTAYSGGLAAMVDGAIATRQSALDGNIAIHNMVAYTKNGWPVGLPLTYNGSDTTNFLADANDFEGVYTSNELMTGVWYDYARPVEYTIRATSNKSGVIKTDSRMYFFSVEYGKDFAGNDISYLLLTDENGNSVGEGVIGKQGSTYEFSFINSNTAQHTWGYKTGEVQPTEDIEEAFENIETATAVNAAYHEGTVATRGYSNVLYCSENTVWNGTDSYNGTDYASIRGQYFRIALPETLVLLYDGVNDAAGPVVFEHIRWDSHNTNVKYVYPNDKNYAFKDYWYGYIQNSISGQNPSGTDHKIWPGTTKYKGTTEAENTFDSYFGYNETKVESVTSNTNNSR